MLKNTFFNYKIKIEIKTTATTVIKNEVKYSPLSEGNICIAEPNLEELSLRSFSKGLVQFIFVKRFTK